MVPLPKSLKFWLKSRLKSARLKYLRARYSVGVPELKACFAQLGIAPGDVLMVHSSLDSFQTFTGSPTQIIAALIDAVGPGGTVMMPTLPFDTTAVQYVARNPVFDLKRTPSKMGLLTELFRRTPGVVRSLHPTHSVAAWGAHAKDITAGHHLAATPCGQNAPFARLLDYDGKILLLGTGIAAMTFYHSVEEFLEPMMPFSPFTTEVFTLASKDASGQLVTIRTRLFDPVCSRKRNLAKLAAALQQNEQWHEARLGYSSAILLRAADVLATCRAMAEKGIYCYD